MIWKFFPKQAHQSAKVIGYNFTQKIQLYFCTLITVQRPPDEQPQGACMHCRKHGTQQWLMGKAKL